MSNNHNPDELPDILTEDDLKELSLGSSSKLNDPAFLDMWARDNQSDEPKWKIYERAGVLHRPAIARKAQELNRQYEGRVTFRPKLRNFEPITLTHEPYDDPYGSWYSEESSVVTDEEYGPNLTEAEENALYYSRHTSLELAQEDEEELNRWIEGQ